MQACKKRFAASFCVGVTWNKLEAAIAMEACRRKFAAWFLVGVTWNKLEAAIGMEACRRRFAVSFLVVLGLVMASTPEAYVFYAGGRDGWVKSPFESYNHWAERNRFQVNDTIVFTYDRGTDSVLVVTEPDFDECNTSNPVRRLDGGYSVFAFDRHGPFFFISGDEDRCQKGQKLYIVVMAPRLAPAVSPALPLAPWAQPPEYTQAPSGLVETSPGSSPEAPPPTSGAAEVPAFRSVGAAVLGVVLGVLVFWLKLFAFGFV